MHKIHSNSIIVAVTMMDKSCWMLSSYNYICFALIFCDYVTRLSYVECTVDVTANVTCDNTPLLQNQACSSIRQWQCNVEMLCQMHALHSCGMS